MICNRLTKAASNNEKIFFLKFNFFHFQKFSIMSRARNRNVASSTTEIPQPPISTNYADNSIKFHFKLHSLITITQLILSTLCLFYIPRQELLKNPVECLKTTNSLLFFVQFIIEIIRWLVYLNSDSNNVGYETKKNFKSLFGDFIKSKGKVS